MRKQHSATAADRLRRMHDSLVKAYGPQFWWPAEARFEVILGALTIEGLRALPLDDLRHIIQPTGFFTRKAPALKAFVAMLDDEYAGSLERMAKAPTAELRERLLALPGVGQETADAILLYALHHPIPVADEYLRRIVVRHQLVQLPTGVRLYQVLSDLTRQAFAKDPPADRAALFNEFHALTVAVGKAHCGRTANCDGCPLAGDLDALRR